jgi:hypothetical protein
MVDSGAGGGWGGTAFGRWVRGGDGWPRFFAFGGWRWGGWGAGIGGRFERIRRVFISGTGTILHFLICPHFA